MQKRQIIWWVGPLLLLGLAVVFRPADPSRSPTPPIDPPSRTGRDRQLPHLPRPTRSAPPSRPQVAQDSHTALTITNWLERVLIHGEMPEPPSPEQIQRWLEANRTNAASLLALRQAGAGINYVNEALKLHPDDPRVLVSALTLNDSEAVKRERLARFKEVAPENALADYVSAREHFKNGNPEKAIEDLMAASTKTGFDDYMVDAIQNCEELYRATGKSPAEAKALACSTALLPHLSQLKGLAQDIASLQSEYVAAGDSASAEALAQYGMQLSRDLVSGDGSKTLIGQLVGIATERIVINALDPATHYDFMSDTPSARLAQLEAQVGAIKADAHAVESWLPTATDDDIQNYFERLKLFGERNAFAWLEERYQNFEPSNE